MGKYDLKAASLPRVQGVLESPEEGVDPKSYQAKLDLERARILAENFKGKPPSPAALAIGLTQDLAAGKHRIERLEVEPVQFIRRGEGAMVRVIEQELEAAACEPAAGSFRPLRLPVQTSTRTYSEPVRSNTSVGACHPVSW